MYIGLRYPEDRKKRKRRKQSRAKSSDGGAAADTAAKQCEYVSVYVLQSRITIQQWALAPHCWSKRPSRARVGTRQNAELGRSAGGGRI